MRTEFIIQTASRNLSPSSLFDHVKDLSFECGYITNVMTLEQGVAMQQARARDCLSEFPELTVLDIPNVIYCGSRLDTSVVIRRIINNQLSIHVSNSDNLKELQGKTDEVIRHILGRTFKTSEKRFLPHPDPGGLYITEASHRPIKIMQGRIIQNALWETIKRNQQDTRWGGAAIILLSVPVILQLFGLSSSGISQSIAGSLTEIAIFAGTTLVISAIGLSITFFDIKQRIAKGSIIAWEEV